MSTKRIEKYNFGAKHETTRTITSYIHPYMCGEYTTYTCDM